MFFLSSENRPVIFITHCLLLTAIFALSSCTDRNRETLDQLRAAKPGLPASDLSKIFKKDKPNYEFTTDAVPYWLDEVISEHPKDGKYWVYYVSSAKMVIVYITPQGKIGFVTWTHT